MRFGLALPQFGAFTEPRDALDVARAAEEMGYDSLWVGDRILVPAQPRDPYPGGDGSIPSQYHSFLDPLTLLTIAATVTHRVRLGSSTLNALWQPPVMLARTLSTLDQLSHGRLDVGIGLGWSRDEYQAVGVPWKGRGARLEETLDIFDAVWTKDVVEHKGPLWTVPSATIGAKPYQRPSPPILLGGFTPATFERIGRRADGWLTAGVPVPVLTRAWKAILVAAEAAGRDPASLRMITRINPKFTETTASDELVPRTGTIGQIIDYVRAVAEISNQEVLIDLQFTTTSIGQLVDLAHRLITDLSDRH